LSIGSPSAQQTLTGSQAQILKGADTSTPNANVSVVKTDKDSTGDVLTFSWSDTWYAALNFEATALVDLSSYMTTPADFKRVISFMKKQASC